ncbi:hypothetical protein [Armatimonas sp.]|uniref:hypothetical protein n=1 Tax=Armatimonas sp. TaxID=1872638 RepID=UPI00286B7C13|nr:hypothetical protein [Armatimonas sp.]
MPDYGTVSLEKYLYWEASEFLTETEQVACEVLAIQGAIQSNLSSLIQERLRRQFQEQFQEQSEAVWALLTDGPEAFYKQTLKHVIAEHGESWMNLCPSCHALCRTCRAKQCPRCFARWD